LDGFLTQILLASGKVRSLEPIADDSETRTVDDLVEAQIAVAKSDKVGDIYGEICNVGSG
jgi:hypothetical protein